MWGCNNCYGEMEKTHVGKNRNRIYCPTCGTEWFVYDDDEIINEAGGELEVEDDEDGDEYGEKLSAGDAALIWVSNGKDEDYMFGYTEEELENAL